MLFFPFFQTSLTNCTPEKRAQEKNGKKFFVLLKPRANGHNIVGCYMLRPFAHPVACCCVLFSLRGRRLEVVGTRKNARARETRLRPFSLSPTTSKRLLHRLRIAGSCCAQFETGQSFERTTPNISSVPWSPKRSATMFDPFAQLFQHLFRGRTCITHSLVPHTYAS